MPYFVMTQWTITVNEFGYITDFNDDDLWLVDDAFILVIVIKKRS